MEDTPLDPPVGATPRSKDPPADLLEDQFPDPLEDPPPDRLVDPPPDPV